MGKECTRGLMALFTKAGGSKTIIMGRGSIRMLLAMFTKVTM